MSREFHRREMRKTVPRPVSADFDDTVKGYKGYSTPSSVNRRIVSDQKNTKDKLTLSKVLSPKFKRLGGV